MNDKVNDKSALGDERLKKAGSSDNRISRESADAERIEKDGTVLTMQERLRMMRSEWTQEVLPTPPKKEGWHYCWLSTTNPADPIYKRIQRGYELVRESELPGFSQVKVTQGEYEGCIACNEMILAKIPEELYQGMMSYFHYEMPLGEEEILKANAKDNLQGQDSDGRDLGQVEGFDNLARPVKQPVFS